MNWEEKNYYQNTYSVSMDDLMTVWVETFHPFETLVVMWDVKNHFDILNYCGIAINPIEAYDNKVLTVQVPGVLEAYELIDSIEKEGYCPYMQVYSNGKLLSDNV